MTWRVDQVDQELGTVSLLAKDVLGVVAFGESGVQGDGSRLDGDATCGKSVFCDSGTFVRREGRTLLLVSTSIGGPGITSLSGGDDTSLSQQGIGEGRFAVVDVSDNTHVTHVGRLLHEIVDLIDGEAGERRRLANSHPPDIMVRLLPLRAIMARQLLFPFCSESTCSWWSRRGAMGSRALIAADGTYLTILADLG